MKTIKLWSVDPDARTVATADAISNAETEELLEDLLVQSPDLLMKNLKIVGRQVPTEGGPLDLLGIDEDGQLVVFELKRGVLTRDAVSQLLDYTSYLAEIDLDDLARLIEQNSGRLGVEKIDSFMDWYNAQFSDPAWLEECPKMVLVGLGVDNRALRIVNLLAEADLEIQLLTFHAFQCDGKLMLARHDEVVTTRAKSVSSGGSKEANERTLRENATRLGVGTLLEDVATTVSRGIPAAYQWPGKYSYAFSLTEQTERGTPSSRTYVNVCLNDGKPGIVTVVFAKRAVAASGPVLQQLCDEFPNATRKVERYGNVEIDISPETWDAISPKLREVFPEMVAGWKRSQEAEEEPEPTAVDNN